MYRFNYQAKPLDDIDYMLGAGALEKLSEGTDAWLQRKIEHMRGTVSTIVENIPNRPKLVRVRLPSCVWC